MVRDAAHRRRHPRRSGRPPVADHDRRHRRTDRRRAGPHPRPGHRAPGRQAEQCAARRLRRGLPVRLRGRPDRRRDPDDRDGCPARNRRLPLAGAGTRPPRHHGGRRLRPGAGAARGDHRAAGVPRRARGVCGGPAVPPAAHPRSSRPGLGPAARGHVRHRARTPAGRRHCCGCVACPCPRGARRDGHRAGPTGRPCATDPRVEAPEPWHPAHPGPCCVRSVDHGDRDGAARGGRSAAGRAGGQGLDRPFADGQPGRDGGRLAGHGPCRGGPHPAPGPRSRRIGVSTDHHRLVTQRARHLRRRARRRGRRADRRGRGTERRVVGRARQPGHHVAERPAGRGGHRDHGAHHARARLDHQAALPVPRPRRSPRPRLSPTPTPTTPTPTPSATDSVPPSPDPTPTVTPTTPGPTPSSSSGTGGGGLGGPSSSTGTTPTGASPTPPGD